MPFAIVAESKDKIEDALGALYEEAVDDVVEFRGEITLYVKSEPILAICKVIKNHDDLKYNMLADLTAVDHLNEMKDGDPRFHVVYHLFSTLSKRRIRIKAPVWEQTPSIDSVTSLWNAANWHERECYDMFGIEFKNHPDLRRILMPSDWEGYPLRKDFPVSDQEPYEYINKQLADE
jgi:NADH-quinone oxidoreductase subunit C